MPKPLWQALVLPIAFGGRRVASNAGGGDSVGGGVASVAGNVRGRSGVASGAGGGASGGVIGGAGGGMGGKCGGTRPANRYLATRPGPRSFKSFARPVVVRALLLEVREHMLGAVGGPQRQCPLVILNVNPKVMLRLVGLIHVSVDFPIHIGSPQLICSGACRAHSRSNLAAWLRCRGMRVERFASQNLGLIDHLNSSRLQNGLRTGCPALIDNKAERDWRIDMPIRALRSDNPPIARWVWP